MQTLPPVTTDFTTIIGRLIAAFRAQLGLSQTAFGTPMGYDRNLVARLEVGRNVASVDNVHDVEHMLIERRLMVRHGDLILLGNRVGLELKRRGIRIVTGKTEELQGCIALDLPTLDRVVAGVVDGYLTAEAV